MVSLYEYIQDIINNSLNENNNTNKKKKLEDQKYINVPLSNGTTVTIDMQKLIQEQERAKAALSHLQPFFTGLINQIKFVYTFHVDTQATDGLSIFVNPYFTNNLTFEQKVFVLAHEIMHCVLNHLRREKEYGMDDHMRANIAADYEVNITLCDWEITNESIIKDIKGLVDSKFSGWGFEKIYEDPLCQKTNEEIKGKDPKPGEKHSKDYKAGWEKAIKEFNEAYKKDKAAAVKKYK